MFARNLRIPRVAIAFAFAAGLAMTSALPAFANTGVGITGTENAELTGLSVPTALSAIALDGANQTSTGTLNSFTVTDARGTGLGWKVTVAASQFQLQGDSSKTLPNGSLTISRPSITAGTGSSSNPNRTADTAALTAIDGASNSYVIATAAAGGDGMGTYTVGSSNLALLIPANAWEGTYSGTVTVDISQAP